jgi:hypothetical protein
MGRVFKPKRFAQGETETGDPDVQKVVDSLAELHNEAIRLTDNLTPQVKAAEDTLIGVINRLKTADQRLAGLLTTVNSQLSVVSDSVLRYQTSQAQGVEQDQRFKSSFVYIIKNVVANARQVVDALEKRTDIISVQTPPTAPALTRKTPEVPVTGVAPETMLKPPMKASCRARVARLAETLIDETQKQQTDMITNVMNVVKSLEPLLDQGESVLNRNQEILKELQSLMSAVSLATQPAPQRVDQFTPTTPTVPAEKPAEKPAEEEGEVGLEEGEELPESDIEIGVKKPKEEEEETEEETEEEK